MPARSLESRKLIAEKILQRYVFEKFAESTSARKALLPERLQSKASDFRVLVPEYDLENPKHRTDFRLFFDGESLPQNIEVEWTTSHFGHAMSVASAHYSNGRGFLIVLDDDKEGAKEELRSLDVVVVEPDEFSWWFSNNAKKIVDSPIAALIREYKRREEKFWVVYVGSKAKAQEDYLQRGRPTGVWAFRYAQGRSLAKVMAITRGDIVIFGTKWSEIPRRKIEPSGAWTCRHVDIFRVTEGYSCDKSDDTFEKPGWRADRKPEEKEYMHYFRFRSKADDESTFETRSEILLQGSDLSEGDADAQIRSAFQYSLNTQGAPSEVDESAVRRLRQLLTSKNKTS